MDKIYVTGMTGTVAPYLKDVLTAQGHNVIDRHIRIQSDTDLEELNTYLNQESPDIIYHLALGPISMAETLATYAQAHQKILVYISTVSVFDDNSGGPYTKETPVDVKNEYGAYKYACEKAILAIHPLSFIIRIGWQISPDQNPTTNNMFNFIHSQKNTANEITVSDAFYPSVSFLDDTAEAIVGIVDTMPPDLYLVNSNAGSSLFQIITQLNQTYNFGLTVIQDNTFKRNDLMRDERVSIPKRF